MITNIKYKFNMFFIILFYANNFPENIYQSNTKKISKNDNSKKFIQYLVF